MVTIQMPGRGLGLGSLSTVVAGAEVGVWPAQQQAGQGTPQRCNLDLIFFREGFKNHTSVIELSNSGSTSNNWVKRDKYTF